MTAGNVRGTQGYAETADTFLAHSEIITFADVHRNVLHLVPKTPSRIADVGAGSGRDAGALAAMGHHVVAVEPVPEFLAEAANLHPSPEIEWLHDSLPELDRLRERGETFDLVFITAVWMHLDEGERRLAMRNVAKLLAPGGIFTLTLRHGPVPAGRSMFEVSGEETIQFATAEELTLVLHLENQPSAYARTDVTWTRLAFTNPISESD